MRWETNGGLEQVVEEFGGEQLMKFMSLMLRSCKRFRQILEKLFGKKQRTKCLDER